MASSHIPVRYIGILAVTALVWVFLPFQLYAQTTPNHLTRAAPLHASPVVLKHTKNDRQKVLRDREILLKRDKTESQERYNIQLFPTTITTSPQAVYNHALRPAAAEEERADPYGGWFKWRHMLGNILGFRSFLSRNGIDLIAHYSSESAGNPSGGRKQDVKYTQQFDIGLNVNLGDLINLRGGTFLLELVHRDGASLSKDAIGNLFAVQELYGAGMDNRLEEAEYLQTFGGGKYDLKVGWGPMGNDFMTEYMACNFQSLAFCGHTILMSGDSGWRNIPTGQWGIRLRRHIVDSVYLQAGVYQSNPYNYGHDTGFKLTFTGTGVIAPFELGWQPHDTFNGLSGNYKIGGYYDSSREPDVYTDIRGAAAGLTGLPFKQHDGRWGVYGLFDQMIYRVAGTQSKGISIFGLVTHGDQRTSKYVYSSSFAIVGQGLLFGRGNDFIGLAWSYIGINNRLGKYQAEYYSRHLMTLNRQTFEQVIELDYGLQLTPWMIVRPNIQYIIRPGATGQIPNAVALGLEGRITF